MSNWIARDNLVRKNTGACLPSEDIPIPISGFGIVLAGRDDVVLDDNAVTANQPPGRYSPGVLVVASTAAFGGADPTANRVRHNGAHHNVPADLVYDNSGTDNRFIETTVEPQSRKISATN